MDCARPIAAAARCSAASESCLLQPPLPSWGNMLNGVQQYLGTATWLATIPGAAITIAVTSFNFIGDRLRDALDVRGDHN